MKNGWLVSILALACLAGCLPEKHVVWSPDGRTAAVFGKAGLYLADGKGKLSPYAEGDAQVPLVSWLPDSRSVVALQITQAETWDAAAAVLTGEQRAEVMRMAAAMRKDILAYEGDVAKLKPKSLEKTDVNPMVVVLCLRDRHSEGLAEKLGEKWDELKEVTASVSALQVHRLVGPGAKGGKVLTRSLATIRSLRLSPDGKGLAFVQGRWKAGRVVYDLWVVPIDASTPPRSVDEEVAIQPDWSPDSRSLVYVVAAGGGDAPKVGAVKVRPVYSSAGKVREDMGEAKVLARVLYDETMKLHWLSDGRILVNTSPASLPAGEKDWHKPPTLFVLTATDTGPVAPLGVSGAAQRRQVSGAFEVSPDEKRVSILDSDGKVAVIELYTGAVVDVQTDKLADNAPKTVPTWRSARELCFVVRAGSKHGSPGRAEVVIWSPEGVRCISRDWPDKAVEGFLPSAPAPAEPATRPAE